MVIEAQELAKKSYHKMVAQSKLTVEDDNEIFKKWIDVYAYSKEDFEEIILSAYTIYIERNLEGDPITLVKALMATEAFKVEY